MRGWFRKGKKEKKEREGGREEKRKDLKLTSKLIERVAAIDRSQACVRDSNFDRNTCKEQLFRVVTRPVGKKLLVQLTFKRGRWLQGS